MAQALFTAEAKEELQHIHKLSCADNDVSLYRRLEREGYCWLAMVKEAVELQFVCPQC